MALEKLGAVMVLASFMLKKHDLKYRIKDGDIRHLICCSLGDTGGLADSVCEEIQDLKTRS
ncbi:MAG: hypothetical protein HUJ51_01860 [Eggerthellaceae bacterium]|nr:hypothetical protein [Eggerthellaceae bacterium]